MTRQILKGGKPMRNMKKWLVLLMTVAMLVNVLGVSAMATENSAPLALSVSRAAEGGMVQVDILATEAQTVADGKLVLTYDPAVLTYVSTVAGTAWTKAEQVDPSVNSNNPGKVILAFANDDAAGEGVLFRVTFSGAVSDTELALTGEYVTDDVPVSGLRVSYCPSESFVDIRNANELSHTAVDYMVGMGDMNGMDTSHFGPNLELNRAMMVTILYRIAGSPAVAADSTFSDVPADEFYTAPVAWAVENGITNGVSASLFAPGKPLTRQELVTFLYRFAGVMGYDRTATTDLSAYTDADEIQSYAVQAFQWAVASGVVNGTSQTTLSPENTTTRAQICIMVSRLLTAQD